MPKGPYPRCLRMADRPLLAGYPRFTVINTESMLLWEKKSDPIIHTNNFVLSGFAMLAPLAVRPFLGDPSRNISETLSQDSVEVNRSSAAAIFEAFEVTNDTTFHEPFSRTIFPCVIVSLPLMVLAFLRLSLFLPERKQILTQQIKPTQIAKAQKSRLSTKYDM